MYKHHQQAKYNTIYTPTLKYNGIHNGSIGKKYQTTKGIFRSKLKSIKNIVTWNEKMKERKNKSNKISP